MEKKKNPCRITQFKTQEDEEDPVIVTEKGQAVIETVGNPPKERCTVGQMKKVFQKKGNDSGIKYC